MAESDIPKEDVFEVDRIRRLVDLMREYDLREIDLRQANQRIRLCRGVEATVPLMAAPVNAVPATVSSRSPARTDSPRTRCGSNSAAGRRIASRCDQESDGGDVLFASQSQGGTLHSLGDIVSPESMVCIIEAMKVFNEIPAEIRGRIVAVLVDDEEAVEFGKPLFKVDTARDATDSAACRAE